MISVTQLKEILADMKKIYDYDETNTMLQINDNPMRSVKNIVEIRTTDKETGINITLKKEPEYEGEWGD